MSQYIFMKLKVPEIPKGIPSEKAWTLFVTKKHGLYYSL